MLEMLRALYRHMAWAGCQILAAARPVPAAAADPELSRALRHAVRRRRFVTGAAR